jgi:hypothetical protein
MEIKQKHGSHRTRYVFEENSLDYEWQDSSGSRRFSVAYTDISRDRQTLTQRNTWLRNAGLLWGVLGLVWLAVGLADGQWGRGVFWTVLGAGCYTIYHLRVVRYLVVPCDKGNLMVLDDEDGKRIVAEMETRRARQFRDEYDFFPENDTPEQLRNRFQWLHREGALSDAEYQQRLAMVEHAEQPASVHETAMAGQLLN